MSSSAAPAPVVIVGPTASGKSAVAMSVATARPDVEIVAVDSMQVYLGMDIGTAKPTAADRAAVVHHGLDLARPSEEFTLAQYVAAARPALDDVMRRGHRVLVVAGTGLYLRGLTDPLELPGRWPEIRAELERAAAATDGPVRLHRRLAALDPLGASRIEPGNTRRTVRALEVTLGAGRPFSSFGPGLGTYAELDWEMFGLRWPRAVLRRRIEDRVTRMMEAGLLDEVRALASGPLSRTAAQALGYRELLDHLRGAMTLDEAIATVVIRTQQFAVRQERWFRRDPRLRWIDVDDDPVAQAAAVIGEALDRS